MIWLVFNQLFLINELSVCIEFMCAFAFDMKNASLDAPEKLFYARMF